LAFLVEIFGEWKWSSVVGFCPKFKSKEEFLVSVIEGGEKTLEAYILHLKANKFYNN